MRRWQKVLCGSFPCLCLHSSNQEAMGHFRLPFILIIFDYVHHLENVWINSLTEMLAMRKICQMMVKTRNSKLITIFCIGWDFRIVNILIYLLINIIREQSGSVFKQLCIGRFHRRAFVRWFSAKVTFRVTSDEGPLVKTSKSVFVYFRQWLYHIWWEVYWHTC